MKISIDCLSALDVNGNLNKLSAKTKTKEMLTNFLPSKDVLQQPHVP